MVIFKNNTMKKQITKELEIRDSLKGFREFLMNYNYCNATVCSYSKTIEELLQFLEKLSIINIGDIKKTHLSAFIEFKKLCGNNKVRNIIRGLEMYTEYLFITKSILLEDT